MPLPRTFWRFAAASGASNLADGVFQVALPLAALQLTRSPLLVAGVSFAAGLPWLLFALVAGVVVDRVDRRRLMAACSAVRSVVIALVAVLLVVGALALWHLYLAALVLGTVETLFDSAAQSVLPMVVPADRLTAANSRLYGVEVTGQVFAGPPLGGLLAGVALALAATSSAVLYAAVAVLLLTLPGRFRADRAPGATGGSGARGVAALRGDVTEGVRYLWAAPTLRRLALLTGGSTLVSNVTFSVLALFAVAPGPMGLTETGYGVFLAASGVGAVLASLVAERVVARLGPARSVRLALLVFAAMVASPLLVRPVAVAVVQAFGAAAVVVYNVVAVSYRQRVVPAQLLGRVNSAYRVLAWGGIPVGAALGGVLAHLVGLRGAFAVAGLAALVLVAGTRGLTDEQLTAAEPAGPTQPTGPTGPAGLERRT